MYDTIRIHVINDGIINHNSDANINNTNDNNIKINITGAPRWDFGGAAHSRARPFLFREEPFCAAP